MFVTWCKVDLKVVSAVPTYFVNILQDLCVAGSHALQSKSRLVEEAVNELIDMLLDFKPKQYEPEVNLLLNLY